mgnify:CR=1 FL=1
MYSKFSCDLTSNFTAVDLTSNFGSEDMTSADSTTTSTGSLEDLKKQLLAATAELTKQEQIAAGNKWGYDECDYVKTWGKFKRNGDKKWDGRCRDARSAYDTAVGKAAGLKKTVENLNKQIDAFKSTDPEIIKAQADADAAIKQSEIVGAATASKTKVIGYAIAAVILIGGITYAIIKLRKK